MDLYSIASYTKRRRFVFAPRNCQLHLVGLQIALARFCLSLSLSLRLEHETLSLARRMRRRSVGDDDSAGSGDGNPSLPTDREHARFVGTYINPLAAFALFSRLGCSLLKSAFHQR